MGLASFYIKAIVYVICLCISFYALSALDFERIIKKNHVSQARILYALLVMGLAHLVASFVLAFVYRI